jgi:hypothetical protein
MCDKYLWQVLAASRTRTQIHVDLWSRVTRTRKFPYPWVFPRVYLWWAAGNPDSCSALVEDLPDSKSTGQMCFLKFGHDSIIDKTIWNKWYVKAMPYYNRNSNTVTVLGVSLLIDHRSRNIMWNLLLCARSSGVNVLIFDKLISSATLFKCCFCLFEVRRVIPAPQSLVRIIFCGAISKTYSGPMIVMINMKADTTQIKIPH